MKKLFSLVVAGLVAGLSPLTSGAQSPALIHYQGRLMNGTNLAVGSIGLSLRLYDAPTLGTLLYEDSNSVTVADGLYSTFIGDDTVSGMLAGALTNAQVFIEVSVNGTALAPRERIAAVGYALRASRLDAPGASNFVARTGDTMGGPLTNLQTITAASFLNPNNVVEASDALALGGYSNRISGSSDYSVIGGGLNQTIGGDAQASVIGGGRNGSIGSESTHSAIGGGMANSIGIAATAATIGGGENNRIGDDASYSTIPGGADVAVSNLAQYAFAAGRQAKAGHSGVFIWADSQGLDFVSTAQNQFLIRAAGGVGIGTNGTAGAMLNVAGTVRATSFSGSGAGLTNIPANAIAEADPKWSAASNSIQTQISAKADSNLVWAAFATTNALALEQNARMDDDASLNSDVTSLNVSVASLTTNVAARLASNVWATADATTNFVRRTGDAMSGALTIAGNLAPSVSNTFSLGTAGQTWASLHLGSRITYFTDLSFSRLGATNMILTTNGNLVVTGTVTAAGFAGSGANLTGLNGGAITAGSISNSLLADGAVTGNKLANGSVTAGKIAANAIASSNIIDGTLTAADFATVGLLSAPGFIPNPTPNTNDQFGSAMAAAGSDRFVIAARMDDSGATNAGCVHLHRSDGTLLATVTNPTPAFDDQFGFSLAGVGTNGFAVGVPSDNAAGTDIGVVYLYNSNGLLQLTITNPAPASGDQFGYSVTGVGSNRVLIGAPFDVLGATNSGAAYLYDLAGNLITNLPSPSPTSGARFGYAVAGATDGGGSPYFVVGAPRDDAVTNDGGTAYLYDAANNSLIATLSNPTPNVSDEFGTTLAGAGNGYIAIGAQFDDAGIVNAGVVHLFDTSGDYQVTITNPAPISSDNFGSSVTRVGATRLLIGAHLDDAGAANAGTAYLYDLNTISLLAVLTNPAPATSDQFGFAATGIGENQIAVGVLLRNGTFADEGGAHLYDAATFNAVVPGLIAAGVAPAAITSSMLADGAVTTASLADGAVTSSKLATNSVTSASIADGAVAATDMGSNSVTTAALADSAVTAAKILQVPVTEVVVGPAFGMAITNPVPGVSDSFGDAAAGLGTNRILISAFQDDVGTNNGAGAVYLYDLTGTLLATITNPSPAPTDFFGSSVAGVGTNRFVIGAKFDDVGAANAGTAFLYDLNGNLSAPMVITNPSPANPEYFGSAAAGVGSNRFVVCAPSHAVGTNSSAGIAYLYDLNGILVKAITNPAPSGGDSFGASAAGAGANQFVIGANGEDAGTNSSSGRVYLYDFNGNLQATITNPAPGDGDNFGLAAAGVGTNFLVIGALFDDAGAASSGSAYLYTVSGSSVALVATITNPAPADGDLFGVSVTGVTSNRFVVGASGDAAGAAGAGSAYLYDTGGNLLAVLANPAPSVGDGFGYTVAGAGPDHFVVAAPSDDAGTTNAGTAYLYSTSTNITTNVVVVGQYAPGLTAERVKDGAVGTSQLAPEVVQQLPLAYLLCTNMVLMGSPVGAYNCTLSAAGQSYLITFINPPSTANYVPLVTPISGTPVSVTISNRTSGSFKIQFSTSAGGVAFSEFSVVVFGGP